MYIYIHMYVYDIYVYLTYTNIYIYILYTCIYIIYIDKIFYIYITTKDELNAMMNEWMNNELNDQMMN